MIMNKRVCLCFSLALSILMLCLAPCGLAENAKFTAGTYTGESVGFGGALKVSVTVDEENILSVDITESSETAGIGSIAVEQLPGKIVSAQSLAVDVVSGCTLSSNAIIAAVDSALSNAVADTSILYQGVSSEQTKNTEVIVKEADMIIVGAGISGMSAAITAAQNGVDAILIEKMAMHGGAGALSEGTVNGGCSQWQKNAGIEGDSPDTIFMDIIKGGEYRSDVRLAWMYANHIGETFDWLTSDLKIPCSTEYRYEAMYSVNRMFTFEGSGSGLANNLFKCVQDAGTEVMMQTRAYELITDNGAVTGVLAEGPNGETYQLNAPVVLLATGGFGANRALLPERLSSALYYGASCSTGDGIEMGLAVGGFTKNMDCGKLPPNGLEYAPGLGMAVSNTKTLLDTSTIMVNKAGVRIVSENGPRSDIMAALAADENHCFYLIMDQTGFDAMRAENKTKFTDDLVEKWFALNGTSAPVFLKNDTLEGAAQAAGIDAQVLKETVAQYNEMIKTKGADEDFGRTNAVYTFSEKGPYYVVEQRSRFATTLGGLGVNEKLQVVTPYDVPIAGLYAAGDTAGGMNGTLALGGNGLGFALTSGRQVALQAALNTDK